MSKTVVVEVYSKPSSGVCIITKVKRFPEGANRDIGRFIKKWSKKINTFGNHYTIEKFTVDNKEINKAFVRQDFIMNRFLKVV